MPTSVAIVVMVLSIAGVALILTEPRRRSRKLAGGLFEAVSDALRDRHYARVLDVGALALDAFKDGSEPWLLIHWMMGQAATMLGDTASAELHLTTVESAIDDEPSLALDIDPGRLVWWLGHVAFMKDRHHEATDRFQRALELMNEHDRPHTLRLLSQVEAGRERFDAAQRLLEESREHSAGPLDDHGYHFVLGGDVLLPQGRLDEALEHLEQAEQGYLELGEVIDAGSARAHRGTAVLTRGDAREGVRLLREALGFVASGPDNAPGEVFVLPRLAMAEVEAGHLLEAGARLERALVLNGIVRSPEAEARIQWASGRLATAEGKAAEARDKLAQAKQGFLEVEKPSLAGLVAAELQRIPD